MRNLVVRMFANWPAILSLAVLTHAMATAPAFAQEPEEEPGPLLVVEEQITVTATRRETPIDAIPVSIVATSGETLQNLEIRDLEEMSRFVPNLLVGDGALTTAVSIRGMGSQPERGFEQSVGLFVDGIYMPRSRQYRSAFLDVNRVEVLRGPQAVLFGLNATAGAVSVVTNRTRPGDPLTVDVRAGYELEYGGPRATAIVGGSLGKNLGLRAAVEGRQEGDYFVNDFDGGSEGGRNDAAFRLSAVWEPVSWASFDLKIEHSSAEYTGDMGEQYGPDGLNQLLLFGLPGADDGELNWRRNMDRTFYPTVTEPFGGRDSPGLSQQSEELALVGSFDVGNHTLRAVFGHSRLSWDSYADVDASPLAIIALGINEEFDQSSIELYLTSPTGGSLEYLVGFYGHDNELGNHQPNIFEPTFSFAPGSYGFDWVYSNGSFTTSSQVLSAFGTASVKLGPSVRLTGGLRYARDNRDYERFAQCLPVRGGVIDFNPSEEDQQIFEDHAADFFCGTLDGYTADRSSDAWMPEVAVEWNTSSGLWYGKYSASAKSGGFAAALVLAEDAVEYDDETAGGFEIGHRSVFAHGRARFNAALFQTDFDDLQLNAFDPVTGSGQITNAAAARSRGLEIDGSWLVSSALKLSGSAAFLDAKYTDFADAPCPISLTLAGVEPPCDATGSTMPRAPKFSGSLAADFDQPLTTGIRLQAGMILGYTDSYHVDSALEPALIQPAYTTLGARVGIESRDGRWSIALVGSNLTNEPILSDALPFLSNIGYLQPPRMIWLQGAFRWQAR